MYYMIELHYDLEHREEALNYMWEHGFAHFGTGITVEGVWIATEDRIAYAIAKAAGDSEIDAACEPLTKYGIVTRRQVTNIHQI